MPTDVKLVPSPYPHNVGIDDEVTVAGENVKVVWVGSPNGQPTAYARSLDKPSRLLAFKLGPYDPLLT
jgi:hypothetical protein